MSFYYNQNRNLSEVFKELQEVRINSSLEHSKQKRSFNIKNLLSSHVNYNLDNINFSHIIISFIILFFIITIFCNKTIFAKTDTSEYEENKNILNIQNIISKNANIDTFKEQSITEYNVVFKTIYTNNPALPKGEEVITQKGVLGKEKVSSVKTYENQQLVDEVILFREKISNSTPQLVDVGTSEFLAKHKIHIGDTMYLVKDKPLKKSATNTSDDIAIIDKNMDVKLIELPSEKWCKVAFDNMEGYIPSSALTSASTTPDIVEKNRILKILLEVNIDMELNKSSNLTKDDYQKIFTDLPQDVNNIFKDNYETFYNVDKEYNINGIFLAAIAIHESNWGSSTIANDKNNLFGYGSYDRNPYEFSYEFEDYRDGIETVAKSLVKNYLHPAGTPIYGDEKAEGTYYNGPTLKGVNTRYASDENWYIKVFNHMQSLYDRL